MTNEYAKANFKKKIFNETVLHVKFNVTVVDAFYIYICIFPLKKEIINAFNNALYQEENEVPMYVCMYVHIYNIHILRKNLLDL